MDCQQCGQPIDTEQTTRAHTFCSIKCKDDYHNAVRKLERKVDRALSVIADIEGMHRDSIVSDVQYNAAIASIRRVLE